MRQDGRLTKPGEFALVYRQGRSWSSGPLVLRAMPNGLPVTRYGFSVSRRIGNAVTRNRVKRWLREIVRAESVRAGYDIVMVARSTAPEAGFAGLKVATEALLKRALLIDGPAEPAGKVGAVAGSG
jgi:ribonuclease P protein component